MSEAPVDLENRDPNNLNDHVKIQFDDVLGEPEASHSIDCVWINSYRCFECWRTCCYKFYTLIFGIPLAMLWGCEYATVTFIHVWYLTPLLKAYMIECGFYQRCYSACLSCCLRPFAEALGYCLSGIRITNIKD